MKQKLSNKWWLPILLLAIVAVAVSSYIILNRKKSVSPSSDTTSSSNVDLSVPTDGQMRDGATTKERIAEKGVKATSASVSVAITNAAINDSVVRIRTVIDSNQLGRCTLILSQGSLTKTYTAEVQPMASTGTCKGFDVPVGDLASGAWKILVKYENDSQSGEASSEVTL